MAHQLQKVFRYDDEKKKVGENGCGEYSSGSLKVPHPASDATFTVPDDGLGYDDGVRVLRTLGSWTPEYPVLGSRPAPGMLFPDLPYAHDMGVQRKPSQGVQSGPAPAAPPSNRPPSQQQVKKEPPPKTNGVSSSGNKSFTCTICGKSLARKDKLVIHTRIHTGEKPYVCEVCDKAFARRDKLVIHMNKMKHRTPTNVAPLGKRSTDKIVGVKKEEEDEDVKPAVSLGAAVANWSCELCGQMMSTREEWMIHAKAHLEEKITGIGVIGPNTFPATQRPNPPYNSAAQMGGYATGQPSNHYQTFLGERQYCPVCRQTFPTKAEFMIHVRGHFAKEDQDGQVDGNAVCS